MNKIRENSVLSGSEGCSGSALQPQFVPDTDRPPTESGKLMDFRMCPVCFFGPIVNTACNDLSAHMGEKSSINGVTALDLPRWHLIRCFQRNVPL